MDRDYMSTERSFVEEAIIEHWGARCSTYEPTCILCDVWLEYDELKATPDLDGNLSNGSPVPSHD